ncbi:putative transcription factor homeobox-WOX family [Helianthus annuus]|uniref:Putative WUSCHEL-related homeobox 8 n=1 Tax=Helianthus annuus TaxID=4232 RepID=A0A251SB26_HELAN|nr:WUSCHEL-related homeobox 8 isoform X1 [Helianthus annuus]KAF5765223.1 putative transcription factor HB-WOX family [Helianthus annuus]KAJ0451783.1 putative transcription factor homeobox-WOX family [Helianthus annuus]KAJ0456459.1 putative transcription factor homeobox-WOX family [Helianthus annuus]KAJ0473672.1 putative transcription factor homeobox-WOX family [Helianthus annuus]KAJ0649249.1 putative transcription factor homeobox-WOX family [Helianthus annuus]
MEQDEGNNNNNNGGMFVKVMTDEQMEVLRKQIAIYATICEQLVDLHKSLTSHHDLAGVRLGNIYNDPLVTSGGHKFSGRQRWTPTPVQLQILERLFEQGNGTPSKQKIKEITSELSQHGQISETNVYNWFQNRRARSKRKQQVSAPNNNGESEVETEVESPKPQQNSTSTADDNMCFQNPNACSVDQRAKKVEPVFPSDASSKPAGNVGQMSYYGSMLSNPRMDRIIGKMEVPGSYQSYMQGDEYNMTG